MILFEDLDSGKVADTAEEGTEFSPAAVVEKVVEFLPEYQHDLNGEIIALLGREVVFSSYVEWIIPVYFR